MSKGQSGSANPQYRGVKDRIVELAQQGYRRNEIASKLDCSYRYTGRVLKAAGIELGYARGEHNPAWRGGRKVDLDGYVLLETSPRRRLEHRQVMAETLGRPLLPEEVVDHIDGITIHNAPSNLRVFASNGEHLKATLTGIPKAISLSGSSNIRAQKKSLVGTSLAPVDTYRLRKERGDVRLRAILRAALELGIAHPCLSGTLHWLEQAGIDPASRSSLRRGWRDLCERWERDLAQ